MKIIIDIPDNMDFRNYDMPYDILEILTNGVPLETNADYTGDKALASVEVWKGVKSDLNNCIDEYGLEDSDIMKTVTYIIDKHMKGVWKNESI